MQSTLAASTLFDATRALAPILQAHRDVTERTGRLAPTVVQAMAEAGLFRLYLPSALSGPEVDVGTFIRIIEEVTQHDTAAGWDLTVWASYSRFAGYLPEDVAHEIYGAAPTAVVSGTINPSGRAVVVPGGYRVSGRWGFGSGIQESSWVIANCIVVDGESQRLGLDGSPEVRIVLVPTTACAVLDTWHVGGLRGTGSHDYQLTDQFVPEAYSFPAFIAAPTQPGTLYKLPLITVFAVSIAAVPLGVARAAISALVGLAGAKTPTGSRSLLRERPGVQADIARAEGLLQSARAFLFETVAALWDEVETIGAASMERRAWVRLACAQVATNAVQAVDLMYQAGGATANYEQSPLERCFRDIHAAAAHIAVTPTNYELCGRVFLGMDPGTPRF